MTKKIFSASFFVLWFAFIASCDLSLKTVDDAQKDYSVYGTLDIDSDRNFIRIQDISKKPDIEFNQELDLEVTMTDLSTNQDQALYDSTKIFDDIITHNFVYESVIKHDNLYRLSYEDNEGFVEEMLIETPARLDYTIEHPGKTCLSPVTLTFRNFDFDNDEKIDFTTRIFILDQEFKLKNGGRSFGSVNLYDDNIKRIFFIPLTFIRNVTDRELGLDCEDLDKDMEFLIEHYSRNKNFNDENEFDDRALPFQNDQLYAYYSFEFVLDLTFED